MFQQVRSTQSGEAVNGDEQDDDREAVDRDEQDDDREAVDRDEQDDDREAVDRNEQDDERNRLDDSEEDELGEDQYDTQGDLLATAKQTNAKAGPTLKVSATGNDPRSDSPTDELADSPLFLKIKIQRPKATPK